MRNSWLVVFFCIFILSCSEDRYVRNVSFPDINGADVVYYRLYSDSRSENRALSMEYAEKYLSSVDSVYACPQLAALCVELADYYEKEKFLFSKAAGWLERASLIYGELGMEYDLALTEFRLAKTYYREYKYDKSLQLAVRTMKIFENKHDTLNIIRTSNLLGAIYYLCDDFETSTRYFESSASMAMNLKDSVSTIISLNNMMISSSVGDTLKIRGLVSKARNYCMEISDTSKLCMVLINTSTAFINHEMYHEARYYLDSARPYLRKINEFAEFYLNDGLIFTSENETDKAISSLEKSLEYYSLGEFDNEKQYCYEVLHELYASKSDYRSAYEYLLKDSQNQKSRRGNDIFLDLYNVRNQIELETERNRINDIRDKSIFFMTVLFMLVIYTVLYASYRSKKQSYVIRQKESELKNLQLENEKNAQEVRSRNQIIELKRMQDFQMQKLTQEMQDKLNKLREELSGNDEIKNKVIQIQGDISSISNDEQWEEMSRYLPEFNSEFYKRLVADFPDLSVNERRLCALLNMNLSTKEIASVTHQSVNSVKVARFRLRTKLGIIGDDITIQEFLQKYNR